MSDFEYPDTAVWEKRGKKIVYFVNAEGETTLSFDALELLLLDGGWDKIK